MNDEDKKFTAFDIAYTIVNNRIKEMKDEVKLRLEKQRLNKNYIKYKNAVKKCQKKYQYNCMIAFKEWQKAQMKAYHKYLDEMTELANKH